ncbi:MAG: hypothetical protein NZ528_07485 [Caldilineales bacterium]|nr:hypothetical protein [Caldilineales bacterium]MDW8318375.1 hypothetical protein [Anaerolineae bacterium]
MRRVIGLLLVMALAVFVVAAAVLVYLRGAPWLGSARSQRVLVTLDAEAASRRPSEAVVLNLQPGGLRLYGFTVRNTGGRSGTLTVENWLVRSFEGGCQPAEMRAGDLTCGNPGEGEGELQYTTVARLFVDVTCDFVLNPGDQFVQTIELATADVAVDLALPMPAGGQACFILAVERPRSQQLARGAVTQGDSVQILWDFVLTGPAP